VTARVNRLKGFRLRHRLEGYRPKGFRLKVRGRRG
jgi:hypothetical protein